MARKGIEYVMVYVSQAEKEKIKETADIEGCSISSFCHSAILKALNDPKIEGKRLIPLFDVEIDEDNTNPSDGQKSAETIAGEVFKELERKNPTQYTGFDLDKYQKETAKTIELSRSMKSST